MRTELTYQQVQAAKRQAADALRDGDHAAATAAYDAAGAQLEALTLAAPLPGIAQEQAIIDQLRERSAAGGRRGRRSSRAWTGAQVPIRGRRTAGRVDV